MPQHLKRNSIITMGLAGVFYWAFMFAKHDPALRPMIPFDEDPYDAVGSFGVIVAVLAGIVALARAFRPYLAAPDVARRMVLVRTQAVVPFAALITVGADVVAMARHPDRWMPVRTELIALLGALAIAALVVLQLLRASREDRANRWSPAILASLIAAAILAIYPEQWINGFATHMLTVIAGDLLLLAPLRLMTDAFVMTNAPAAPRRWSAAAIIGILVGVAAFAAEMSEGTAHMPIGRLLFIASVFIGLTLTGMLIVYAFLAKPLGFGG